MTRRHNGPLSVSLDASAAGIDDPFVNETRVRHGAVQLPSDRFTNGRQTLTFDEWRRAHAVTYGDDDVECTLGNDCDDTLCRHEAKA